MRANENREVEELNKVNSELTNFPLWFNPREYVTDETPEHMRISMFFVMNYPDPKQNKKAKQLEDFGWKGYDLVKLLKEFMINNNIISGDLVTTEYDTLLKFTQDLDLVNLPTDHRQRGALFYTYSDVQSILLITRNALVHGSYARVVRNGIVFYLLENRMPKENTHGIYRGRLYIKQDSLLNLIELINKGPSKSMALSV